MRVYVVALTLGLAAVLVGSGSRRSGAARSMRSSRRRSSCGPRSSAASAVAALWLIGRAVAALSGGDSPDRDMTTMIRGVRFVFLAVAALAAAAGWFIGHPLLLVVALVIAGVDVVETTFLLIVARRSHADGTLPPVRGSRSGSRA